MFVLHQRINKIFWSPIIDPIVLVKIGKWKPYYFFVCGTIPGEKRTNTLSYHAWRSLLMTEIKENIKVILCERRNGSGLGSNCLAFPVPPQQTRNRIFWKDNLRIETNTLEPIIAILESLPRRVENKTRGQWPGDPALLFIANKIIEELKAGNSSGWENLLTLGAARS